jgi:CheY-like chemotaxis protein
MLAVSDDGCGMDRDTIANIFEPFFTTKELGKGTGLGLATVYGIIKQNNGFANVYSEPGRGTTFRIYLPRHGTEVSVAEEEKEELKVPGGTETVLIVEDEEAVLDLSKNMLEKLGYRVLAARKSDQAICLVQEHEDNIDLLLTDVVMPDMNGRELAGRLGSVRPGMKYLYMSGYTANVIAHHGILDQGVNFIPKPFTLKELGQKVREALDENFR